MNTFGVVALAFLGGIFLIVIVFAVAASLWVSWTVMSKVKELSSKIEQLSSLGEQDREELKKILESGKGVFQGIRSELNKNMETQSGEMRQTFKLFEDGFKGALKNLNGKSLLEASKTSVSAVKRLEEVAIALHQLVMATSDSVNTPQEWQNPAKADEHAPEGQSRIGKSLYQTMDDVDEEQTAEAFSQVTGGMFQ
jgi:hypothetical protein